MRYTTKDQTGFLMNEEGASGGGAAVAAPTPSGGEGAASEGQVPSFDASGIFDHEGKFNAIGERYQNEEVKGDYINQHFKGKTPAEVAKILKDNQTAARAKAVTYPGADATEEDWSRYREAVGVPQEVSQVMPENFEEFQNATGWTPEVANPVVEALIQAGAPGPVITAGMAAVQAAAAQQGEAWAAEAKAAQDAAKAAMQEKYGTKYQAKMDNVSVAVDKAGVLAGLDQAEINDIKEGLQSFRHPGLTRLLAVMGDTVQEAAYRGPGAAQKADEFRGGMDTSNAIMNDPSHPLYEKYWAGDRQVNAHVDNLLKVEAGLG